ncbi:hypothetical protein WJX81_007872 [Elliptochloris bilobata]|uniref:Uncharacterized protein n=1 Tax=Elliptochloris bilobata TaxID=381761 RepID=A0AAW1SJ08_9CHLO
MVALRGAVSSTAALDFRRALRRHARFKLEQRAQLADIYAELVAPRKRGSAARADAAMLGDAWLGPAIRAGLLQPIPDALASRWWAGLSPRWRRLLRRDANGRLSDHGDVWAAPHRWGCTLVAARKDKLLRWGGRPIRDWGDLLQPRLRGRLAMVDSPRELVAVALATLGLPLNATAADVLMAGVGVDGLRARVDELRQQVRVFSSREHTRALAAGDVWAVVGWSGDLLPIAERSANVTLSAPVSGVPLWADLWTVPAGASGGSQGRGPSPLLPAWLEFGLQPARAERRRGMLEFLAPLDEDTAALHWSVLHPEQRDSL